MAHHPSAAPPPRRLPLRAETPRLRRRSNHRPSRPPPRPRPLQSHPRNNPRRLPQMPRPRRRRPSLRRKPPPRSSRSRRGGEGHSANCEAPRPSARSLPASETWKCGTMTLAALNGHELVETRDCRIAGCANEAENSSPRRGPWANLCEEHNRRERERRREGRPARRSSAGAVSGEGFEAKARGLVVVGRRLDGAIRKYRPARAEMDEAMRAWAEMCRVLAGDSSEGSGG